MKNTSTDKQTPITLKNLQKGWVFTFDNSHLINTGQNQRCVAIYFSFSAVLQKYIIVFGGECWEAKNGYSLSFILLDDAQIKLTEKINEYNLELKSMNLKTS